MKQIRDICMILATCIMMIITICNTACHIDAIFVTDEQDKIELVTNIKPIGLVELESMDEPIEPTEPMDEPVEETTEVIDEFVEEPIEIVEEPVAEIIVEPKQWWTEYELDMLAAIIYYEAGSDTCSDRHQQLVGQVVLNRMADKRFPNTMYNVLTQVNPVQYSTSESILADMGNRDIIPQRCYDNALIVLNGEVECPPDVIYQANFKQGTGIYEEHHTPYSISYFCHG